MVMTEQAQAVFDDARVLQADALEMLVMGKIRNAAEKAWGATKRATDALILARTGEDPEFSPATALGLRHLQAEDEAVRQAHLVPRYYTRQGQLPRRLFLHEPVRTPGRNGAPDPGDGRLHRRRRGAGELLVEPVGIEKPPGGELHLGGSIRTADKGKWSSKPATRC